MLTYFLFLNAFFFLCGCGALKLHTTLVGLVLFGFLVWVVFLLCFVCGERVWFTQSCWIPCWGSEGVVWEHVGAFVSVSMLVVFSSCFLGYGRLHG